MGTFGNTTLVGSPATVGPKSAPATRVSMTADTKQKLDSITVWVRNLAGTSFFIETALYEDGIAYPNDPEPVKLLDESPSAIEIPDGYDDWITVPMSGDYILTPNGYYWLCVHNYSENMRIYYDTSPTDRDYMNSTLAVAGSFNDPYGGGTTATSKFAIYGNYSEYSKKIVASTGLYYADGSTPWDINSALTEAAGLVDGATETTIVTGLQYTAIGLDLGDNKAVEKLIFYDWDIAGIDLDNSFDSLSIYSSTDGINWTLVETFNDVERTSGDEGRVGRIEIDLSSPETARYFCRYYNSPLKTSGDLTIVGGSEVEAYGEDVTFIESGSIKSNAFINDKPVNPTSFTFADPTFVSSIDTNRSTFDVKLKHICNHQIHGVQYRLNTCPRCLGEGYYYDIKFNALGKPETVSLEDKLSQALEKIVLTNNNVFHPEVAAGVKERLGFLLENAKPLIRNDILEGIRTLQNEQKKVSGLSSRARIVSITGIEVTEIATSHLYYKVTVTTASGERQQLTGEISLPGGIDG